nr:MAG TPA: hypothetical protein [Microviridae sp.]DAY17741.1 MAG TPA: hypothetical protein [Microviridae sp.]
MSLRNGPLKALFYFQFPRQWLAPSVPSTFKSRHL